ncbi:WD40 repeat-containing protein [Desulfonema limicola]|uniref:WD40 repeat-containing protein n=1 Tax=Desulfonema limicola TaxID=45656 RepID=A0A975GIU7_9BACT|nr:PQQ-binding-like beta-propeller repeat protein [Desulfonema limicola]QTA82303.1 WD40 repeat-containing protein [Desulfonema limicola]
MLIIRNAFTALTAFLFVMQLSAFDSALAEKQDNIYNIGPVLWHQDDIGVTYGAFSPDGEYILTSSYTELFLWNTKTGKIHRRYQIPDYTITCAAFSSDGKFVLAASEQTITLWDAHGQNEIRRFQPEIKNIDALAFSPDGLCFLAANSFNQTAYLINLKDGEVIRSFEDLSGIHSIAFSPDNKYILTGSSGSASLWNRETGAEILKFKSEGIFFDAAFSPDNRYLLTSIGEEAVLWDVESGLEIRRFMHTELIQSLAFSPDGKYAATGDIDTTVCIWKVADGQKIHTLQGHTHYITSVSFSPDGKYILTGSNDKTAQLWNTETGKPIGQKSLVDSPRLVPQLGHSRTITDLDISPDGKQLVTASQDSSACLWDVKTGRLIRKFTGHSEEINDVDFAPDGSLIITGSDDGSALIWDAKTGKTIQQFTPDSCITAVAFSPDAKYAATGADSNWIRIWDTKTGIEITRMYFENETCKGRSLGIGSVIFTPDGQYILSGSSDCIARLSDVKNGKVIRKYIGHSDSINSAAISHDGSMLLTGSYDNTARLWDIHTGKEIRCFKERLELVDDIEFALNNKSIVIGGSFAACLWDIQSGKEISCFFNKRFINTLVQPAQVSSVRISPDGKSLFTGYFNGHIKSWNINTGKEIMSYQPFLHPADRASFSPDGRLMAVGNVLWNMKTGIEARRFNEEWTYGTNLIFSPDGRFILLYASYDLRLVDIEKGNECILYEPGSINSHQSPNASLNSAGFSPDGKFFVTCEYKIVRLWDTITKKEIQSFKHEGNVTCAAFSSDGSIIVTGSMYEDNNLKSWDIETGEEIGSYQIQDDDFNDPIGISDVEFLADTDKILIGGNSNLFILDLTSKKITDRLRGDPGNSINDISISNDGRFAAAAFTDAKALIWDIQNGKIVHRLEGHMGRVNSAAFSPDGKWILTASEDGTGILWDADTGMSASRILSFKDGLWAVIDKDGRYDSNSPGDLPGVSWIMPDEPLKPYPLEIFIKEYYTPRLLTRKLANEKFEPVRILSELNRFQPEINITEIQPEKDIHRVSVTVEITDARKKPENKAKFGEKNKGIFNLKLFRDGQMVAYAPEKDGEIKTDSNTGKSVITFSNIALPSNKPAFESFVYNFSRDSSGSLVSNSSLTPSKIKNVTFSAYCFNSDNIKSQTDKIDYIIPDEITPRKAVAYVIAIGVNAHENELWDLKYAVNDAAAIHDIISKHLKGGKKKFDEVVSLLMVSDYEIKNGVKHTTVNLAAKNNIRAVFDRLAGRDVKLSNMGNIGGMEKLKTANPEDLILISFSGHGYADKNGIFHLFPHDIGKGNNQTVDAELLKHTISSDDLSHWLRDVDAGDMIMIVDACNSAASVEGKGFKPGPMGSRGLGQLAYNKGMRILAASQAENVALESDLIQHGVLTYALIREGIESQKADHEPEDKKITAGEWLKFGEKRVPELYTQISSGKFQPVSRGNQKGKVLWIKPPKDKKMKKQFNIQQPSLFDFTRKKSDVVITSTD